MIIFFLVVCFLFVSPKERERESPSPSFLNFSSLFLCVFVHICKKNLKNTFSKKKNEGGVKERRKRGGGSGEETKTVVLVSKKKKTFLSLSLFFVSILVNDAVHARIRRPTTGSQGHTLRRRSGGRGQRGGAPRGVHPLWRDQGEFVFSDGFFPCSSSTSRLKSKVPSYPNDLRGFCAHY